jgi:hypothetical protein
LGEGFVSVNHCVWERGRERGIDHVLNKESAHLFVVGIGQQGKSVSNSWHWGCSRN